MSNNETDNDLSEEMGKGDNCNEEDVCEMQPRSNSSHFPVIWPHGSSSCIVIHEVSNSNC